MKSLAILFCLFITAASNAQSTNATDTGHVLIPAITYNRLDSLISHPSTKYTAIYFWPTWCAPCVQKVPHIINAVASRKDITLLMINDPDSREYVKKKLVQQSDHLSYYRVEGRVSRMVAVNDMSEIRYFNQHFTKETSKRKNERNPAFFLFDEQGKLLYYNKQLLEVDSVKNTLIQFQ